MSSGRSLDAALAEHEAKVADDDRSLLRMLCYGSLRRHWRLQSWIGQLLDRPLKQRDSVANALLAIGLFQLTETRIPDHAVVSQTVEASRLLRHDSPGSSTRSCAASCAGAREFTPEVT